MEIFNLAHSKTENLYVNTRGGYGQVGFKRVNILYKNICF